MPDNAPFTPGQGRLAATDQVTYSGDTADVQLVRGVLVTGSEGAKTVVDPAVGAGAAGTNTERVILASDDPAVTSLAVIDDWDESDRAKVNPVVGQAGVAAGAGATSAATQRVVVASDDVLVTALATSLGTDGSSPPALPGSATGVRGWLRYLTSLCGTLVTRGSVNAQTVQVVDSLGNQVNAFGGGTGAAVTASFTRPANTTAYTAGDVVSDSVSATTMMTFSNVVSANGRGAYVRGVRLTTSKKSITPQIRVHLFADNTATVGVDNAAFRSSYADHAKRVGTIDLPAMTTPADTANSDQSSSANFTAAVRFQCGGASRAVYAVLETIDAFTPDSGQGFTMTLLVDGES